MAIKDNLAMLAQLQQLAASEQNQKRQEQQLLSQQAEAQQGIDYSQLLAGAAQGAQSPDLPQFNQLLEQGPVPQDSPAYDLNPDPSNQDRLQAMLGASLQSDNPNALSGSATISGLLDDTTGEGFVGLTPKDITSEKAFIVQQYKKNTNKVPQNAEEWQEALNIAYGDDFHGERRKFADATTAGRVRIEGLDAENPGLLTVTDSHTGEQFQTESQGNTIDQKLEIPSDAVVEKVTQFKHLDDLVEEIRDIYNPDYVGLLDNRARNVGKNFIDMPEFAAFDQKIRQLIELAYSISGKQLSDNEREYIKGAFLPQPTWTEENYKASLDNFKNYLSSRAGSYIETLGEARRFIPDSLKDKYTKSKGKSVTGDAVDQAMLEMGANANEQDIETWLLLNGYKLD